MLSDLLLLSLRTLLKLKLRTALSMLGIAIGVASVVLLTSIGEGTRRYILGQFSQFGTNILAINPGKTETAGIPGVFGGSTRPLTIDDAEELERIAGVDAVVPVALGSARVESPATGLARRVMVYGVTPEIREVWRFRVAQGSFWPRGDPRRGCPGLRARPDARPRALRRAEPVWASSCGWRERASG